jgi:hypothetical protein
LRLSSWVRWPVEIGWKNAGQLLRTWVGVIGLTVVAGALWALLGDWPKGVSVDGEVIY